MNQLITTYLISPTGVTKELTDIRNIWIGSQITPSIHFHFKHSELPLREPSNPPIIEEKIQLQWAPLKAMRTKSR